MPLSALTAEEAEAAAGIFLLTYCNIAGRIQTADCQAFLPCEPLSLRKTGTPASPKAVVRNIRTRW